MEPNIPQPIINERHETRVNFLKKDKNQLAKRFEDLKERLSNTKNTIQTLLVSGQQITENEKSSILDYFNEEKNYLSNKIREIKAENEEAKIKSNDQRKKIEEIIKRESDIESDFAAKFEAVLKESKEKEEVIQKLSQKNEDLDTEFKDLAKIRLTSAANSKEIPSLLETKKCAINRVIKKVNEFSKFLESENLAIQNKIESDYKELMKLNCHAKIPLKMSKPLEEFLKPTVYNLVQADIRAKLELPPDAKSIPPAFHYKRKNNKIQSKLEEKFIKIESLCNELKTAEIINKSLKEDKNFLHASVSHLHPRKGTKQVTSKINHSESYFKVHKRVLSNPLDYCIDKLGEKETVAENHLVDSDFSKDLDNYSSVEENFEQVVGDSIIDDILDI